MRQKLHTLYKKNIFFLAVIVALIGSMGNALQGVYNKYYCGLLGISTYQLLTIRCMVEVVIFAPFCLKYFKDFKKNYKIVLLLAFFYSCDILLYNTGLQTVSVNTGTLIMLLVPFWMCVFGRIILKEKSMNIVNIAALIVCVAAVGYSIKGEVGFNGFQIGMLFILANSVILPIGVVLQKKFDAARPVIFALFTNAIMLGIIGYFLSYSTTGTAALPISFEVLKSAFVVAIFDTMECAGVYLSCKMAYVALLQPVRFTRFAFASIFSSIILSQSLTKYQIITATIILCANLVATAYSQRGYKNK